MNNVNFLGLDCCTLENGVVELIVSRSVGPRVLSFRFRDGENLFAELPDFTIECPGSGTYHIYGGHRLWAAPEEPARTYLPDDSPVDIAETEGGLLVTQPVEAGSGIQKQLEIRLSDDSARVTVTHILKNHGPDAVRYAPWAITQLRTGGMAILPQNSADTGVLPNRSLVLWPYTDLADPNLRWQGDYLLVDAAMGSPFKVGFPNPRGWMAYWLDGTLFVKHAAFDPRAEYYDFGSSSECYCNARFLELETLAPIRAIPPGGSVSHVETWALHRGVDRPDDVGALVDELAL